MKKPDMVSQLLPNTYPFPNVIMDPLEQLDGRNIWSLLMPPEQALLPFIYRKTFGWWKRADRIANSVLVAASGLGEETVRKYMESLVQIGLVARVSENNDKFNGIEWAPQIDDALINFEFLLQRASLKKAVNFHRIHKARFSLSGSTPVGQGYSVGQGSSTPVGQGSSTPVGQGTQKPKKTKENQIDLSIENQVAAGVPVITPFMPELVKLAVEESLKLNVPWGRKRPKKWSSQDDYFIPQDFLDFAKRENIAPDQIRAAVKLWEADRKTFWKGYSLTALWEYWPALSQLLAAQGTEAEYKVY